MSSTRELVLALVIVVVIMSPTIIGWLVEKISWWTTGSGWGEETPGA